jgi:hypothetical protein
MGGSEGLIQREIAYQPLPSQQKFHASEARFKGFSGPIGSGKSQALCQEAIRLGYINSGRTGLIGAPTYPMLRDATLQALLGVLERNRIPFDYNKAENVLRLRDTGSKILFRAVDEFERLRGSNLAWFGIDELTYTQPEAWQRLEGRLRDPEASRLCGFAVWTPKGFDWVYERFIANPVPGYEVVIAKPRENRHLLEQVPDYYDRLKESYDERFYQQEVLGEYVEQSAGRVYGSFDRRLHVRETEWDRNRTLMWSLDFNVDPMSSVVAQARGDRVEVIDEIVLRNSSTAEACEEFVRRYGLQAGSLRVYGDASGRHAQTTGRSDLAIVREHLGRHGFRQAEYRIPVANPAVRERVGLVNARLKSAADEIRLHVDPKCRELIKDLEQVVYKERSGLIDKERDALRTHLSDALGYLLWQEFGAGDDVGERSHPLL